MVVRPPPDVSLYHRKANRLFPQVLDLLGNREDVHAVVVPRTVQQRTYVQALRFPSLIVPDGAVDAQSSAAWTSGSSAKGGCVR